MIFASQNSFSNQKLVTELRQQAFLSFYKGYITQQKIAYDESHWSLQEIDSLEAIIKSARPNRKFYNNSILWYKTKNKKLGFRPIDTPTDCKSGCTPVVFHLVLDEFGSTIKILEENEPLRKKWHQPFTPDDKKKLLKLCKELPEKLRLIEHPLELTNSSSTFPPQTWTFYQDVLIKDGAYTSYVVYNVAQKTKEFITPNLSFKKSEEQEQKKLRELFSKPITSSQELLNLLVGMKKLCDSSKTYAVKKSLLENILKAIHYLAISGEDLEKNDTKMADMQNALILNYLNHFSEYFINYTQTHFLNFLNHLIHKKNGRNFLLLIQKHFISWKKIPKDIRLSLPFLAQGFSSNLEYLKQHEKKMDESKLFEFASQNSFLLHCFIKAYLTLKNKDLASKAYARLLIRFPSSEYINDIAMPSDWNKSIEVHKNLELHKYTEVLTREFSQSQSKLPSITGLMPYSKDKKKTLPHKKDKKQIYIFFAPWCAHCHGLLKDLGKTMPKSFWEKTQLICVFSDDTKMLEQFITHTNLKENSLSTVSNIVMLQENKETRAFYNEKLNLFAVPKIILTDKKGQIINFSYRLDPHPEKDLNRDLELIFSQFN